MKLEHTEFEFVRDKNKYWKCYCTVSNRRPANSKRNWRPSTSAKTRKEAREIYKIYRAVEKAKRQ